MATVITCIKCKIPKDIENYPKGNNTCKLCISIQNKKWNIKNRTKIKEYNKKWNTDNIQKVKKYYIYNKERINNYEKLNRNKDSKKQYQKQYDTVNKVNKNEYLKKYIKKRYKEDIEFKLKIILRSRFYQVITKYKGKKIISIINIIGVSQLKLKQYIESLFKPEMTWSNYGSVWEIDHIIPCNSFDLTKLEEQQKCFHYTNLQPLFITTEIAESYGYINEIGNRNKGDNICLQ